MASNGGIGRVVSVLTEALIKEENVDINVCAFYDEISESYYPLDPKCQFDVLFSDHITMQDAIIKKHAVSKMVAYLKQNNIDIVVACGVMYYPLAVISAKLCHIRCICWEHTNPKIGTDYKFQTISRRFGAYFSDCNVVLTKSALKTYNRQYPLKKNIQIYNPVDSRLFASQYQYSPHSKKIISVGRLKAPKNFDRLLEIAAKIIPKHPDWVWDIYGDGELKPHLMAKAKELHLSNNVYFRGQVSNIYEQYPYYAFIVMTSDYEGFPMVLLEGAANGLPMIAFDVPTGPNEIITQQNGFLIPPGRSQDMIDAIDFLMMHDDIRLQMSKKARIKASEFEIQEICSQWRAVFIETLNKKTWKKKRPISFVF